VPTFPDHIQQTSHNLAFLTATTELGTDMFYDWQITICFYCAVHAVNAHLATHGHQFRRHRDVDNCLNPEIEGNDCALTQEGYIAYTALRKLSRRSRYLVNEKNLDSNSASISHEKHFRKALFHLDTLFVELGKVIGRQHFPRTTVYITGSPHTNNYQFFSIQRREITENAV
jgi:uncharacterized protein (UPF0332 family)